MFGITQTTDGPAVVLDAETYWAALFGDRTPAEAVADWDLAPLTQYELGHWLARAERAATAQGAVGLADADWSLRAGAMAAILDAVAGGAR